MAITSANAVYTGNGPTETGMVVASPGETGGVAKRLMGIATVTGDGASSTFDVNWIDGTKTLAAAPSGVLCVRTGGAATNTIAVLAVESITTTKFTVRTSAAVNAATFIVAFYAMP